MPPERFVQIQVAPRGVFPSAELLCRLTKKHYPVLTGWFFALAGIWTFISIVVSVDKRDYGKDEWKPIGKARIVKIDGRDNARKQYEFQLTDENGNDVRGECKSKYVYNVGDKIQVVQSVQRPELVKLEDSIFGSDDNPLIAILPLIFCGLGLCFVVDVFRHGQRAADLLKNGVPVLATVDGYDVVGQSHVKHWPMVKYYLTFNDEGGQEYHVESQETRRSLDNITPTMNLFYDPKDPSKTMVWDLYPSSIVYRPEHNLFTGRIWSILPQLACVVFFLFSVCFAILTVAKIFL